MRSIPRIGLLLTVIVLLGLTGCASHQKGAIMPGANLGELKSYYVVHLPADSREVNKLICDDLIARGYRASTGEAINTPAEVDALVTYQDKWMWDITMYMLQLDIQFRKPTTEIPLATGQSLRTSLKRKSANSMVTEVLDQIFQKAGNASAPALGNK